MESNSHRALFQDVGAMRLSKLAIYDELKGWQAAIGSMLGFLALMVAAHGTMRQRETARTSNS
jgi:hypothetical protein